MKSLTPLQFAVFVAMNMTVLKRTLVMVRYGLLLRSESVSIGCLRNMARTNKRTKMTERDVLSRPQYQGSVMTDRDPVWDALNERGKNKFDADRERFLKQAVTDDDGGWTKHTPYHWSRSINGERMDYWPSRKKFQWRGKVMRGLGAMYRIIKSGHGTKENQ